MKPDSATWQLLGVIHKLEITHVAASWGHGPDSMSNSKSSAKRRARRWRGPGNPSCPYPLPASSACARRLCCGSPPCRSGSRSPPSSPVSLAEGLPALTSLCLQKHHTLLSLSSSKAEGDSVHLALATTEEGAGHRASMWISVAWPLFVSPIDPLTLTTTSGQPCTRPGSKS